MRLLLLILLSISLSAEDRFAFMNDVFSPGGKDRYLSNKVGGSVKISPNEKIGLWNEMYTPDDLRSSEIPYGDHPYSGYSYVSYLKRLPVSDNEFRLLQANVGLLGDASKTKRLQKWVHNDLDLGTDPKGWDTQNPSELALDLIYSHVSDRQLNSVLGDTTLRSTYGIRVGNVITEAFLDQKVTKRLYGLIHSFVGLEGHLKAFDTHLEGRLFRDNKYTVDMEPFVASARAGVGVTVGEYDVGFMYVIQTPTFREQRDNHIYGSLFINKDW